MNPPDLFNRVRSPSSPGRTRVKAVAATVLAPIALAGALMGTAAAIPAPPVCFPTTDLYVTDNSAFGAVNGGLIQVDAATGTRTPLSENNAPVGGPDFETPWGMTVDAGGDLLVAEQWIVGAVRVPAVIRVNRTTGVRTLVSSNTAPAGGPSFSTPSGIVLEADGNILVADMTAFPQGAGGVIRVNPVTGQRTTVSRNAAPAGGPSFNGPMDLTVADNGDIYVANTFGSQVIGVDPQTGARTLISGNAAPAGGPAFVWPWGMTIASDGAILIADSEAFNGPGGIIRVDPATGTRTTLSSNNNPAGGPLFSHPGDLVLGSCGDIFVTDSGTNAVYRVDPVTGARATVSDNASAGSPNYAWPQGIVARSRPTLELPDLPGGLPTTSTPAD